MQRLLKVALVAIWACLNVAVALAEPIKSVQMRDADLTATADQNYITTLGTFSGSHILTLPEHSALNGSYIQFVDTERTLTSASYVTIVAPNGLINGKPDLIVDTAGSYVLLAPSSDGYTAAVFSGGTGLSEISSGTVLGNFSGADAVPQAVYPSTMLDSFGTMSGITLYRSVSGWAPLPPGTAGQIYTIGTDLMPEWSTPSSAHVQHVFTSTGSIAIPAGATWAKFTLVGGGAGGTPSSQTNDAYSAASSDGGKSCVDTTSSGACTLYVAGGGQFATPSTSAGGFGGTCSGSGTFLYGVSGADGGGMDGSQVGQYRKGMRGGDSGLGFGTGSEASFAGHAGGPAHGYGGGGQGGGAGTTLTGGSYLPAKQGGGGGAGCVAYISNPTVGATYYVTVGTGGSGGVNTDINHAASSFAGGAGSQGIVIFEAGN